MIAGLTFAERGTVSRYGNLLRNMAVLTAVIMLLSSWARTLNPGLACPGWPVCGAPLAGGFNWAVFVERSGQLSVGLLAAFMVVSALRVVREPLLRSQFGGLSALLTLVVAAQVTAVLIAPRLGEEFAPLPQAVSLFCLAVLSLAVCKAGRVARADDDVQRFVLGRWHRGLTIALAGALLLQTVLGLTVAGYHAASACPDFPLCQGALWPAGQPVAATLTASHRLLAVGVFLLTVALQVVLAPVRVPKRTRGVLRMLPTVLGIQIMLGVMAGGDSAAIWLAPVHLALALVACTAVMVSVYEVNVYGRLGAATRYFGLQPPPRTVDGPE